MIKSISNWFKKYSSRIVNSIAFYPTLLSLLYLFVALLIVKFDFSDWGMSLKERFEWLEIKSPDTARSIITSVAAGMISLTVFSFSMVMIVLTRAAAQMSNRILDNLIGNRFQQFCLGFYIGTIIYAFYLLSSIRDSQDSSEIPSLGIFLLTLAVVFNLFVFIYFLHYVTQSVKYENIVRRIFISTEKSVNKTCITTQTPEEIQIPPKTLDLKANTSGVFEGINLSLLTELFEDQKCHIYFTKKRGTFVLRGETIAHIDQFIDPTLMKEMNRAIYIHASESVENNYNFGLQQLSEIAIKALSPGINDPGTAILALRSLTILLSYLIQHRPEEKIRLTKTAQIHLPSRSFEDIFEECIFPILDYGKNDRLMMNAMQNTLNQLLKIKDTAIIVETLKKVNFSLSEMNNEFSDT